MRCLKWCCLLTVLVPPPAHADSFDRYTNKVIAQAPQSKSVEKVTKLTPAEMADYGGVLKDTTAAVLIVHTNEDRWARLLVQPAAQKIGDDKSLPILLIDRFVTYREGTDQAVHARAEDVRLFDGFVLSLDIGQVVPADVGGDLRFTVKDGKMAVEPVGKAEFYVLTQPMPEAAPAKGAKLEIGTKFEPRYFNGNYKLYEDGRRSGTLHLKVDAKGDVLGHYYSDKDGQKYEVTGAVGDPNHSIDFRIIYPRTVQSFRGWLFTGNGQALTGSARMQQHETGFYALREE